MSDSDPAVLGEAVETAQNQFAYGEGTIEDGLEDPESDAVGQLRRGCRLLAAARTLRDANGYHTAVFDLAVATHEFLRDHPSEHYGCPCD